MSRFIYVLVLPALMFMPSVMADEGDPWLSFTRYSRDIAQPDLTPNVQIFESGRVLIHVPLYMKSSGDYEFWLTAEEMKTMRSSFGPGSELAKLDVDELVGDVARASMAKSVAGERFYTSESTITLLHLDGRSQPMVWENLQSEQQRFKDIDGLNVLARAERMLLELTASPRRQSVSVKETVR